MLEASIHGIILAFGLILPLGVQNVFIFNQGATQPTLIRAVPAVITAAICDTILILFAILGVSLILFTFAWMETILFGIGFFFLLYMGWMIWKSESANVSGAETKRFSMKKQIVFAASVSLFNPHAILDTIGVIGTNSLSYGGDEKWAFTMATILVSWIWFFGLALAGRALGKLSHQGIIMRRVNKISGLIIWGVALYMGWKMLT